MFFAAISLGSTTLATVQELLRVQYVDFLAASSKGSDAMAGARHMNALDWTSAVLLSALSMASCAAPPL